MTTRVDELKTVLGKKVEELQQFAAKGIKIEDGNVEVKSEDAAAVKKLFAECEEIKSYILIEQFGHDTKAWLDNGGKASDLEKSWATGAAAAQKVQLARSLGAMFTESKEFQDFANSGGHGKMATPFGIEAYDITNGQSYMQRKDVYGAMNSQVLTQGVGTVIQFDPTVPRGRRPNRVRDLFPQAATSANLIDFFQVLGFVEGIDATSPVGGRGNAQTVQDYTGGAFGTKPKSNLIFRPQQAPVRTLAHWEAAHRNVIQDVPALQAVINNELMYGLQLVEDDQILNGDGTNANLKGILQTEYIQTYTAVTGELFSDSLRRAATLSMLANYPSTGYVLHPLDWEHTELQKGVAGSGGDGQYMLFTNVAIGAQLTAWRNPVVETPAIAQGTFLSGAFGTGAQVYDRQEANIRIADQHGNFFIQNAIAILCEERLALAVKRPEAFVMGTFDPAQLS